MAQVKIKKLDPNATIPTSGSAFAAGYDLYACLSGDGEVTIPAHHTVMVPTGIAVALPEGTFGGVFARSGLASREGLRPASPAELERAMTMDDLLMPRESEKQRR